MSSDLSKTVPLKDGSGTAPWLTSAQGGASAKGDRAVSAAMAGLSAASLNCPKSGLRAMLKSVLKPSIFLSIAPPLSSGSACPELASRVRLP